MYSKKVLQHFLRPRFFGKIKNADGVGHTGNPLCGDVMELYLKIDEKSQKIKDIKFHTTGCLPSNGKVLINWGDWERISSIKEGIPVLNGSGRKTCVIETYVREYKGPMLTIVPFVSTFNKFSLTPEHPILCIKRDRLKSTRRSSKQCKWLRIKRTELISKKPRYVLAENLAKSDYLVYVPNKKIIDNSLFSKEIMKLIGYYLAEGYGCKNIANNNYILAFSLNKNERKNISELKSLLLKITGKKPKERIRKNVNEISISSKKWLNFLKSVAGQYASEKKLSDEILLLPFEKQWEMIKTYIKGDGNLYKRRPDNSPTYRISTASRELAIQIQEILARGGIFASIKIDTRFRGLIEGREVFYHPLYEISFKLDRKHKFVHTNGKYFLVPIRKIEKKQYKGKVYNFQVKGKPNSYLVKGFAVHNCAAAIASSDMVCEVVKSKTIKEALKIDFKDILKKLGNLPPVKVHCSILATQALKSAIDDYRGKSKT